MITKEQYFRLKVFLFISFSLFIIILTLFILPKLKKEGDIYFINFKETSINGLNVGNSVKYLGVNIGRVVRAEVNAEDLNSILVYVSIKQSFPVKKGMGARLQYAGITGSKFIEISGGVNESEELNPGEEIRMGKGLGEKAEDIVTNIDTAVKRINHLLSEDNQDKVAKMVENLEKSSGIILNVLGDKKKDMEKTLYNIDNITSRLNSVAVNLELFSGNLKKLSESLKLEKMIEDSSDIISNLAERFSDKEMGAILKSLNEFVKRSTDGLKEIEFRFRDMENEMSKTFENLRLSMDNIARFTRSLSEDPTILFSRKKNKRRSK
ncbi:MAG: MlaD family protein [Acidobacteriota bacterium]